MALSQLSTEELVAQLREALASRESDKALYLLVTALAGDPLTEELPICDPSGRPVGYLVPARERYALHTTAEYRAMQEDGRKLMASPDSKKGWTR
jgi:hypothetical protein